MTVHRKFKPEKPVPQPTVLIRNDSEGGHSMIVREVGSEERAILRPGISCLFTVPHQGLIVFYAEKKGGQ